MRKSTMWFLNRSDTNLAVQTQKMTRGWKVEELYYLYSKTQGTDQLGSNCEADLGLCFRIMQNVFFLMKMMINSISNHLHFLETRGPLVL